MGMIEPVPVLDVFCSGLGAVENIGGGCLRLYLYVVQVPLDGGAPEKIIVGKVIFPAGAVPDAAMQMLTAVGGADIKAIPSVAGAVH